MNDYQKRKAELALVVVACLFSFIFGVETGRKPVTVINKTVVTSASTAQDCINMFFEQLSKDEDFIKSQQLPVRKP